MTRHQRAILAACGLLALAAFVVLTILVIRDAPGLVRFDQSGHDSWRSYSLDHGRWLATMRVITQLGSTVTILVVDVALVAVCLARRRTRLAAFVAVVGLGGWASRILIRDGVDRPRPDDQLWISYDASFPSGHTTNATLMMGLIVVVCWPLVGTAARWTMIVGAVVASVLVGLSRIAGGVHWPSDALGGWALAISYACLVAAAFPWPRATRRVVDRSAASAVGRVG